ncbi:MAG: hypothetical protein H9Q65_05920 [Spiroplasma ixodetis]|nr:hypothetical protein [Spiroplasma ixodetis]
MNKEIEQEIKNLMFKEIKKLKTYAINYHNYKKKIQFNDIDIQNINNSIEDKSKKIKGGSQKSRKMNYYKNKFFSKLPF